MKLLTTVAAVAALTCGVAQADTRTVLVNNIKAAENVLQLDNGRIFAGGFDGLYELVQSASGGQYTARKLTTAYTTPVGGSVPAAGTGCYFTGLAVRGQQLFAACFITTTGDLSGITARYLMSVDLAGDTQTVREAYRFDDSVRLPNGIAFGPDKALYVADSGDMRMSCFSTAVVRPGRVLRAELDASAPRVTRIAQWQASSNHPNGLRADAASVYYTENKRVCNFGMLTNTGTLYRAPVSTSGSTGALATVYTRSAYLDDFTLVKDGVVLTDNRAYNGTLVHVSEAGKVSHTSTLWLNSPSSVRLLNQAGSYHLVATEISANSVARVQTTWGLLPR